MARNQLSSSEAAALVSEEGLYEVPVLDWNTASEIKSPLPPRPPRAPPAPSRSALSAALDIAVEKEGDKGRECNDDERKILRRTVSNRLAARKSRKKKFITIAENERRSKELTVFIDSIRPKVEALEVKKKNLQEENASLQAAYRARANQSLIDKNLTTELELELARLKQNLAVMHLNPLVVNPQVAVVPPQPQPQPQPQAQPFSFFQEKMPENAQPQPQLQPQPYSFFQNMPENAQPQPYSFFQQKMPENAQPQPYSFFQQKMPENFQPQARDFVEVDQYLNLDGCENMGFGELGP